MILSCTYWNDRHGLVCAPQPAASVPWPETHARLTSAFAGAAFRVKATKAAMVCEVLDIMNSQVLRRGNERRTGAQAESDPNRLDKNSLAYKQIQEAKNYPQDRVKAIEDAAQEELNRHPSN